MVREIVCAKCGQPHDPRRCIAHVKWPSLRPCRRFPSAGSTVCTSHGGRAPQVRAKARQRLALREALQSTSRRHPAEVLLDAVHALDVIEREARAALGQGATPEQLDRWLTAVVDAAAMARTALSASAEDTVARARAAATEAMSEVEAMARLRQIRDEADRRLARAEVEP